jgi:hypothetical protein
MITQIAIEVIKQVPYLGPGIQSIEIVIAAKKIVESSTPLGATKIIASRFIKECTPPEIFIAGKYARI